MKKLAAAAIALAIGLGVVIASSSWGASNPSCPQQNNPKPCEGCCGPPPGPPGAPPPSPPPSPPPPPAPSNSSSSQRFKPVEMGPNGFSAEYFVDFALPMTTGVLPFKRHYLGPVSSANESHGWGQYPQPFGYNMGSQTSVYWFGSFTPSVQKASTPWLYKSWEGELRAFNPCTIPDGGVGCWASPNLRDMSFRDRLWWRGDGFDVYPDNGTKLVFNAAYAESSGAVNHDFFLTEAYDRAGTLLLTVTYATPPGGICPAQHIASGGGTTPGAPYIDTITTADGNQFKFNWVAMPAYNNTSVSECVLRSVTSLDRDGGTYTPLATYHYVTADGGTSAPERAGLLAQVDLPTRTETYSYTGSQFSIGTLAAGQTEPAVWTMTHTLDVNNRVIAESAPDENVSFAFDSGTPYAPSDECGATRYASQALVNSAGFGDNSNANAGFVETFVTVPSSNALLGPFVSEEIHTCTGTNSCSPGSYKFLRTCPVNANPPSVGEEYAMKDKRNNWRVDSWADAGAPHPPQQREMTKRVWGAVDKTGAGALLAEQYGYVYGPNGEQLKSYSEQDSLLGGSGTTARTMDVYDANDRQTARIRHGWTKVWDSASNTWSTQERYVGTFYLTRQSCSGSAVDDPQGRILEIHGPCLVDPSSGFAASDCSTSLQASYPVKQFTYFPSDGTNNSSQLQKESVYPNASVPAGCSTSTHLDTTYGPYDARGNPLSVTDSNGATTAYRYEENRVTSRMVAGKTWNYAYDNGLLTRVQLPEGNYDVMCYRSGTTPGGACGSADGAWTPQLQWRAKVDSSLATWSELVVYDYWPDGTMKTATYEAPGPTVRRIERFSADAHKRPTWSQLGDATDTVTAALFDGADNQSGIGFSYNSPSDFCGGQVEADAGQPISRACHAAFFDRVNRLAGLDNRPNSSSPTADERTCLQYDAQGNVKTLQSGCSPTANPGDCSACTQPASSYQYDDFGNVVSATLPWLSNGAGGAGTTAYEYDALGNLIRKQTPEMVSNGSTLEYAYDQLGRRVSATRKWTGPSPGSEQLFALDYDSSLVLSSTCPQPSNTNGRLLRRTDSFGATWYQYDDFGHVVGEIRLRTGASTCGPANTHDNPHTFYTYTGNGNLSSITYPYGRTVTYVYPTAGAAASDRVSEIDVSTFLADGGTSTLQPITQVAWEPFGGLRGYQINHPVSGTSSVEYALGDDATPAGGCTTPGVNDNSGRIRALWVSSGSFSTSSLGDGSILKQDYTWQGDQLTQQDTCVLGGSTPITEQFAYDQDLRLTSATRPSGNFAATGGAFSSLSVSYDKRGNPTGWSTDGHSRTLTYAASPHADQLTKWQTPYPTTGPSEAFTYDKDGRVATISGPVDRTGSPNWTWTLAPGPSAGGATGTVYKSVDVGGLSYGYFYDALGRRRMKSYPGGQSDEYFSRTDDVLLTDQGNFDTTVASVRPVDDYVWLNGRPILMARGSLDSDSNWSRRADSDGATRAGEPTTTGGLYFVVTDYIGKPVLTLNAAGAVTGFADYDPHGYPNRVALFGETPHPEGASYDADIATFSLPTTPLQVSGLRVLFNLLDPCSGFQSDTIRLDSKDGLLLNNTLWQSAGPPQGRYWTPFVEFDPSASFAVHYTSSTQSQCKAVLSAYGAIVQAYEYRQSQSGVGWFWTPLRFPGHYYDAETDTFENWHRSYSAAAGGRYLAPEPLLATGDLALLLNAKGFVVPAYQYAGNNPVMMYDPDGTSERQYRRDGQGSMTAYEAEAQMRAYLRGQCHKEAEDHKKQCTDKLNNKAAASCPKSGAGMGDLKQLEAAMARNAAECNKGASCEEQACVDSVNDVNSTGRYALSYSQCMQKR